MKRRSFLTLFALAIGAALLVGGPVVADSRGGPPPKARSGYARHYPPPGHVVHTLPRGYHVSRHHYDGRYYYNRGVWYRPYGAYYRVVAPPIGISVSYLPDLYTTVWFGGIPYYYANSVYYTRRAEGYGYLVSEPPAGATARNATATMPVYGEEIFVYPRQGQSEATLAHDRYECHRWAVSQTGFDPSQPGGGVTESQNALSRSDYRRAITACLEARGYTVR